MYHRRYVPRNETTTGLVITWTTLSFDGLTVQEAEKTQF